MLDRAPRPISGWRRGRALAGVAALAALALLVGCPPSLEDPERFPVCSPALAGADVIELRCAGAACHNPGVQDRVDLLSPGVIARLANVPADDGDGGPLCGKLLADCADPAQSYLLHKINATREVVGAPMPVNRALCEPEKAALTSWLRTELEAHCAGLPSGGADAGVPDACVVEAGADASGDAP